MYTARENLSIPEKQEISDYTKVKLYVDQFG